METLSFSSVLWPSVRPSPTTTPFNPPSFSAPLCFIKDPCWYFLCIYSLLLLRRVGIRLPALMGLCVCVSVIYFLFYFLFYFFILFFGGFWVVGKEKKQELNKRDELMTHSYYYIIITEENGERPISQSLDGTMSDGRVLHIRI